MLTAITAMPVQAVDNDSLPSGAHAKVVQILQGEKTGIREKGDSLIYRSIKYAGKYHLLALHFPIAFLLVAMGVQWFVVATGRGSGLAAALLWFGAAGAVVAATLGWMYAYDSAYFGTDAKLLFWHRWLGTSTALLAVVTLFLKNRLGPKSLGVLLSVSAGLVVAAAHFGGSLVRGSDFLMKF